MGDGNPVKDFGAIVVGGRPSLGQVGVAEANIGAELGGGRGLHDTMVCEDGE